MFQRNERAPVTPGRSGQRFWSVLGLLYVLVELTRVRYFLVLQIMNAIRVTIFSLINLSTSCLCLGLLKHCHEELANI
jgi:hypothetical protein